MCRGIAGVKNGEFYDAAIAMYKSACAYCKWKNQGIVTISGMTERDSMASSPKLEEVRELARKLA